VKKRIVTVALVIALIAVLATSTTMAFLTDNKAQTNTFTIGNVEIALYESTLNRQDDTTTDDAIKTDAAGYGAYLAEQGKDVVPGRVVKKAPYVDNTGKNAAYVRIKMIVPNEFYAVLDIAENADANIVKTVSAGATETTVTYTYQAPLGAEEDTMTFLAPFYQVSLKSALDNADLTNINSEIEVVAEAIQAEGFNTAAEAFAAFENQ